MAEESPKTARLLSLSCSKEGTRANVARAASDGSALPSQLFFLGIKRLLAALGSSCNLVVSDGHFLDDIRMHSSVLTEGLLTEAIGTFAPKRAVVRVTASVSSKGGRALPKTLQRIVKDMGALKKTRWWREANLTLNVSVVEAPFATSQKVLFSARVGPLSRTC